jgi:hypothetical protein
MDAYLKRALDAMETATEAMTVAELARRKPGKWSAVEIVEHVSLACNGTSRLLQWYLDTNKLGADKPTERQQVMTRFVIEGGNFPPGQTAPSFATPKGIDPESVLPFLRAAIVGLDAAVARCEQTFGCEVTLGKHAVLGPLTGKQWCQFHWVHTSHHVKQIEEIKRWVSE